MGNVSKLKIYLTHGKYALYIDKIILLNSFIIKNQLNMQWVGNKFKERLGGQCYNYFNLKRKIIHKLQIKAENIKSGELNSKFI